MFMLNRIWDNGQEERVDFEHFPDIAAFDFERAFRRATAGHAFSRKGFKDTKSQHRVSRDCEEVIVFSKTKR